MITILYIISIYVLVGAVVYLIAQQQNDENMTLFKQELFLLLGFIFKPIIITILVVDEFMIPKIKQKLTIRWIKKQYNKQLKNKNLSDEERQLIIHRRDALVNFFSNVIQSEPDEYEE